MRSVGTTLTAALFTSIVLLSTAFAKEPWQLGHGPFTTAADVREHNLFGQDLADIRAALSGPKADWPAALALYTYGKNFKVHSVGRFADDYNGRLSTYLPAATKHFGSPSYQNAFLFSALAGTGRFARASELERSAALDAGMTALVLNWGRYELGESERKANKMTPPNWALTNGSPKNWNEIFAFHYGPEGRHAAFEALEKIEGGSAINNRLLAALDEGQRDLVAQKWSPAAARKISASLNAASLALLRDALAKGDGAPDDQLAVTQARAAGYWLAASETISALAPDKLKTVETAISGKPDRAAFKAASAALEGIPQD
jgi:hypothetical protein